MSNGSTPKLNSCGCCQGEPDLVTVNNRPGLSALSYRIGNYGLFFQRMLDQIHSYSIPDGSAHPPHPLAALTTRSEDDPAIALLDAWAVIADVLTFYQERIANEGYLRTATERRSILELAREIGYELSPGVAASAYLQFTVEEVIGTAPPPSVNIPGVKLQPPAGPGSSAFNQGVVDIPEGTQVQSVPAPGTVPQTFETSADFQAQADWNTLQPRLSRQQDLALDRQGNLYLLGTSSSFPSGAVQLQISDLYLLNPLTQLDFMSNTFHPPHFHGGLIFEGTTFLNATGLRQLTINKVQALSAVSKIAAAGSQKGAAALSKSSFTVEKASAASAHTVEALAIAKEPASSAMVRTVGEEIAFGGIGTAGGIGGVRGGTGITQSGPPGPTVPGVPVNFIYLQGTSTNIRAGDRLLLVGKQNTATMSKVFIVRNVVADSATNTTLVEFADSFALPAFSPGSFPATDLKLQGIAFNQDNVASYILSKTITEGDLQAFMKMNGWNEEDLATLVNNPPPPPPSEQGVYSFGAKASFFGNNAPLWKSLTKPSVALRDDPYPLDWDAANNGAGRSIWTDSQGSPLRDGDVYLDRAYPQILTNSWAAFESPNIPVDAVFQVTGVAERSAADYTLSGRTTALTLQLTPSTVGIGLGSPSAVSWSANRLDAFALGFDGNLWHRWWNGSSWGGPQNLGGGKLINSPSVASWAANRLDVFAVGSDGDLYHSAWNGSNWAGPENLGGGNLINSPSAVSWAANRLDIFAIGSDGNLYHKWWGGSSWGGLENRGGGNFINSPSAVSWAANRLDVFAVGSDGNLYHTWWDGSHWGGWENRGGGNFVGSPSAVSWAANRLDVFTIGNDGNLYHAWWDGSQWGGPESLGGGNLVNSPSAVSWAANRLDIFAVGSDGNLHHKWWDGAWGGPENLGGNGDLMNAPSAVSWSSGRLDVFIIGASGHWFHKWWGGSWGGPQDLGNGSIAFFPVRTTTAWVQSQQLALAGVPVVDEIPAGTTSLMLNNMVLGLTPGQSVALSGTQSDPPGVAGNEILFLQNITHTAGFTVLSFTTVPGFNTGLKNNYIRSSVVISANVTLATHGATVQEVLGSGDGSKTNQSFTLKRPPLTYVSAPTPSGTASTLQVRVNGLEWKASPTLYGLNASDQEYIVRLADDGTPTLTFGDPASRLKTGQQNVTATYRTGIGLAGNVGAGTLSLLQSRPPGLRTVTNPLAASGGADPQNISDARANAPLTVLTLDRIVSVEDYQSFAQAFAGVGKAQAVALWNGHTTVVQITIAAADGSSVNLSDPLAQTLTQAITLAHDPVQNFVVAGFQPLTFNLTAGVLIDQPRYQASAVMSAVTSALTNAFAFSQRSFAQPVTAAEILELIQSIPGVIAVDLTQLYFTSDATGPNQTEPLPFLTALPARFASGAIQPAQLLLLNPLGAKVTEMMS
jgi:Baseplate J-like protein/Repeat of unknown function (DUF346)